MCQTTVPAPGFEELTLGKGARGERKPPGVERAWKWVEWGPARDGLWGGRSRERRLVVRTRAWKVLDLRGRRERLRKVLDTQTCLVGAHLEEAKGHEAAEEAGLHR